MSRFAVCALALTLLVPAAAQAQMDHDDGLPSWHDEQMTDIRTVADKFIALAEAFPEDTYDWRPMEGVRSVRDVMALMVAEFYLFPALWGHEAPEGVPGGFGPAIEMYSTYSRDQLIAELRTSADFIMSTLEGMDHDERHAEADWFGRPVLTETAIGLAAGDMHEHLGQAIAYARTNRIVPPWSR